LGEEYKSFSSSLCNLLHSPVTSSLFSSLFVCCAMFPLETLPPPRDPSGGVVYLRIVLPPEQASRMCVFLNHFFYREGLLASRPPPQLQDHPSSAVRDCLFNLIASTLIIGSRSSIRNLRTRHAVVTGTHYIEYTPSNFLKIHLVIVISGLQ